jgi:hypothetical protein
MANQKTMQAPPAPAQHTLTAKPEPTPDSWYITRRDALMDGDPGVLPSGDTCVEQRTEYSELAVEAGTPAAATLVSIAPATATVGGADFTLTATGTGFVSGDAIVVNNVPASTTLVSATELTTPLVGANLTAGALPVLVRRGSTDTPPQTLTVT